MSNFGNILKGLQQRVSVGRGGLPINAKATGPQPAMPTGKTPVLNQALASMKPKGGL